MVKAPGSCVEHPDESSVEALGLFEEQDLCAVAAWSPTTETPGISQHHVLAVRNGRKRRGSGERLLREVLERARAAGADAVVSLIHVENEPMLILSGRFGAETSTDPRDLDYRLCTIPLARR
jgi:ribosomal protein S18 acetylase RimI-like enzyme